LQKRGILRFIIREIISDISIKHYFWVQIEEIFWNEKHRFLLFISTKSDCIDFSRTYFQATLI